MLVTPSHCAVADRWFALSAAAAALAAVAGAAGILAPSIYARETALWAAQGAGQDAVTLLAAPAILAAAWHARRGGIAATFVWLGLMLYLAYSYVLCAFFVHFNALFLVYTGVLGLSVYAIAGAAADLGRGEWDRRFAGAKGEHALAGLMIVAAIAFAALWLSEIVPALVAGGPPPSARDAGLLVNPVHVLDLGLVFPAMLASGILLWRRRTIGFLAALPLAAFMVTMGVAIVGMAMAMAVRGLGSAAAAVPMAALCRGHGARRRARASIDPTVLAGGSGTTLSDAARSSLRARISGPPRNIPPPEIRHRPTLRYEIRPICARWTGTSLAVIAAGGSHAQRACGVSRVGGPGDALVQLGRPGQGVRRRSVFPLPPLHPRRAGRGRSDRRQPIRLEVPRSGVHGQVPRLASR